MEQSFDREPRNMIVTLVTRATVPAFRVTGLVYDDRKFYLAFALGGGRRKL